MLPGQRAGFLEPPSGLEAKELSIFIWWTLHTEIHEGF